jgi:DNA-binding transcriptional ArsR family regulator
MNRPYFVSAPKQIAAISSPGRDEMVDMIGIIGPCTVSELARAMGRSRHALYYHVRALVACGLLKEKRARKPSRRQAARYEVVGRPIVVRFDLSTAKSKRAVLDLAHARLRSAARGFDRACHPQMAEVEGPRRNLWATRWKGWLSAGELEEVNRCFAKLIDAMHGQPGDAGQRRKCYELTFVFAPTVPQPRQPQRRRARPSRKFLAGSTVKVM